MRKVTSAIEGMSVAEVRRGLDTIRTRWNQRPARFYFTDKLFNDMTIQQFCMQFTLGHHTKRHAKSKRGRPSPPSQRITRSSTHRNTTST